MKNASAIFRFLLDAAAAGERVALVTITDVIGSSSRAPGTHMAVAESGTFIGSFSGGCIEAAVIGEAQRVISTGVSERLRLGEGSPLIDIRLPCGGGVDLLFTPQPPIAEIRKALGLLDARRAVEMRLSPDGGIAVAESADATASAWSDGIFAARHAPDLNLVILGHGAETPALAALARAYGLAVAIFSPDETIVENAAQAGLQATFLKTPARHPTLVTDRFTAVVFLFHDHDWETALMAQVLEQDAFYIGAMGSRRTHAERVAALLDHGVPAAQADRVKGPIGLIPATRDPDTLALSVLAQIAGYAATTGSKDAVRAGK